MKEIPESGPNAVTGAALIAEKLSQLPGSPGVYRMLNGEGRVLYVGKAKNLRKRVVAYTHPERIGPRIRRMVLETHFLEIVTTHTEAEALLLEADLIKSLKPRYNILLRDDKSFPEIRLTRDHAFPRVLKHRGAHQPDNLYFGPFASAWAVNQTLQVLQRAFLLRTCSDNIFVGRTRPCLLHQIKRCCAPCVDHVSEAEYGALVDQAQAFLSGRSQEIQQHLASLMQAASDDLDFEAAAQYRDRIRAMTRVQAHTEVDLSGVAEADVIALHQEGGQTCVQVFFFRSGRNYGNRAYYPAHAKQDGTGEILEAFVGQFYASRRPPKLVLLDRRLPHHDLVTEALGVRAKRKVRVEAPQRGEKRAAVDYAARNAAEALSRRLSETSAQRKLLEALADVLGLEGPPGRIEVYDNSHTRGTQQVGGMIVAGPEGFDKKAYRKFNIKSAIAPGDDYGMMREVLSRRFGRALKEDPDRQSGQWPDLVLIDGGKGQLGIATEVFADLGIEDLPLVAVSKGPDRNAGRERLHRPDQPVLELEARDPVLYFIQRLRDEAHRFAIGSHRQKRAARTTQSPLDDIPGIGAARKKALLHHFGSARAVSEAGLADLEAVTGISAALAKKLYDWFHGGV
ncbi:excinuclease ABC subunit UvrC [Magnetospira sp. QH-2]|uniref:excinuclease ABC subunit UvrC n=1 Tax=Magnetospira sp. (strain QH-2) TaxID=1288970 RepID=UPI0003E80BF1|nr:excinuclease ABC subunit UvrC [Magnetospira sp. QH-2]CCQ74861.1 UvrABC system protein C [Magnetospira sp. QH-2]